MATRLYLPPPGDAALPEVLWRVLEESSCNRRVAAIEWAIVRHYLQGCRFFDDIDYETGIVRPSYRSTSGGVPFKYEEILNKRGTEISRLLRLDIAPSVTRRATGLDSLRQESLSQATLDAITPLLNIEATKRHFCELLVDYGSAGILAYEIPKSEAGKDPAVGWEVIPSWELLSLPAAAKTAAEVAGWARTRWVALASLKGSKLGGKAVFDSLDPHDSDVQARFLPAGSSLSEGPTNLTTPRSEASFITDPVTGLPSKPKPKNEERGEPFIKLSELWIPHPSGRLSRYTVMAGKKIVHDKAFDNAHDTPMMPLGVAIRQEGVGTHGRGFVGPMIPLNREAESAILNLLRNIQNLNLMGLTGIPQSWGVSTEDLQAANDGTGFFFYDPDPTAREDDIKRITPTTTGLLPRDILNLAISLMDRMSQQPEVTQGGAPGRVDSKAGLSFLYQTSTMPLGEVASSIAGAFGVAYRAILGFARDWKSLTLNMTTLRDESVAGIVFDPRTGKLDLSRNSLPDPSTMELGIKSQVPVDKDALEAKLNGLLQAGVVSQQQYRIEARLRALNIPLPDDAEWQNYRTAVLRNIVLFNNGETPGDISAIGLDPANDTGLSFSEIPAVHLSVIDRFMASPEFAMASQAVQSKFNELRRRFSAQSGSFPDQLPYPEDMAMMGGPTQGGAAPAQPAVPNIQQMLSMMGGQPPQ